MKIKISELAQVGAEILIEDQSRVVELDLGGTEERPRFNIVAKAEGYDSWLQLRHSFKSYDSAYRVAQKIAVAKVIETDNWYVEDDERIGRTERYLEQTSNIDCPA